MKGKKQPVAALDEPIAGSAPPGGNSGIFIGAF
jgi:hypothetical protein